MKRVDIIKKLRAEGWLVTHGGKHDMAIHPDKPGKIPIPRKNEINEYTSKAILKDAGLE